MVLGTRIVAFALVPAILAGLAVADVPPGKDYGAGLSLEQPTSLAVVLADPEGFAGRPVLLHGRVSDVCQKKGCWTILQDGDALVRVRFKDYGFFLPRESLGNEAFVEGLVSVEILSEKQARHYAAESRAGRPLEIVGAQREVGLVASGVRLLSSKRP